MKTIEVKLYSFSELSEEAKERAVENLSTINVNYEWWDAVYEDFENLCRELRIEVDLKKTYFNGFCCQGSGSSFNASFNLRDLLKSIEAKRHLSYAPKDAPELCLPDIDRRVLKLLYKNYIPVYCSIKDCNGGMSVSASVSIYFDKLYSSNIDKELDKIEDYCQEIADELNNWLYRRLEQEYEYLTSEEAIIDTIEANEYYFTEDGKIY
ncbi:MAG: hypothetical protein GYA14_15900 [Ignavibacteria bacterium]|nr:hypothetical protein [Ignavibacteria bacterium]